MLSDNILFNMYLLFATLFIYILPLFIFKKQDYFSIIYEIMPITIDHQLREQITHEASVFPITYFHNELATLLNWEGPLHWHPEFEIATAVSGILDFQVGQKHLTWEAGDCIFINGNILHGIRQVSGDVPDPMLNIVFSDIIFALGTSVIYQKYIRPIAGSDALPFIMFRHGNSWHDEVNRLAEDIYWQLLPAEKVSKAGGCCCRAADTGIL